jgi:hypothetical protein
MIQTVVTVHPSQWLMTCGMNFGIQAEFSESIWGFEYRLKSYRAVPDNALIFELCEKGDTTAIQRLFDERRASPWDTNSRGLTPLFVSFSLESTFVAEFGLGLTFHGISNHTQLTC